MVLVYTVFKRGSTYPKHTSLLLAESSEELQKSIALLCSCPGVPHKNNPVATPSTQEDCKGPSDGASHIRAQDSEFTVSRCSLASSLIYAYIAALAPTSSGIAEIILNASDLSS